MDKFSHAIIKHKKYVLMAFLTATLLGVILLSLVSVNYNLADDLPKNAQSTIAIKIMEDEFGGDMPNTRAMLTGVSIWEALDYKDKIQSVDGVISVNWLDDVVGLDILQTTPLDFIDTQILESYYKDDNALMSLSIARGKERSAIDSIYAIVGNDNAVAGEAVNTAETQAMSVSEVVKAMAILLPIIIIILIISTNSWAEPLLFLSSIGVAIIINMGTNIIFGEISFITYTVSPILQLAVSLDYAIFLLHSFNDHRLSHKPDKAMAMAMKETLPTVAASAATTIIGFAALMFMRFGIGADLGLNLLKGITFSFISVMIFMPAATLTFYKLIDKTKHRKFMPSFKKAGTCLMKVKFPLLIVALLVLAPVFLAQSNTEFIYGTGSIAAASRAGKDNISIEEKFGRENPCIIGA